MDADVVSNAKLRLLPSEPVLDNASTKRRRVDIEPQVAMAHAAVLESINLLSVARTPRSQSASQLESLCSENNPFVKRNGRRSTGSPTTKTRFQSPSDLRNGNIYRQTLIKENNNKRVTFLSGAAWLKSRKGLTESASSPALRDQLVNCSVETTDEKDSLQPRRCKRRMSSEHMDTSSVLPTYLPTVLRHPLRRHPLRDEKKIFVLYL